MKSTDVYREARGVLAAWSKASGFKRTSGGMLGWTKVVADDHLFFWLQVSQDGWDAYAGSKFVVEFQRSQSAHMFDAGRDVVRRRLPHFLRDHELEDVRTLQNDVIRSLQRPPRDYFLYQMDAKVVAWYEAKFDPVADRYRRDEDIWFRYHEPAHVRRWAEFVMEVLPRVVHELEERQHPSS